MTKCVFVAAVLVMASHSAYAADLEIEELRGSIGHEWSGLYVGASVGYAETEDYDAAFPVGPGLTIPLYSEGSNESFGVHIGYMHEFDNWVVGAEYEYTDLDIQYIGEGVGPIPVFLEDAHMIKGRLGYSFDNVLVYGTAGALYARTNDFVGLADWTPMVGIGLAVALSENLIVGGEYTHGFFESFDGRPIEGTLDNYTARVSWKL